MVKWGLQSERDLWAVAPDSFVLEAERCIANEAEGDGKIREGLMSERVRCCPVELVFISASAIDFLYDGWANHLTHTFHRWSLL